jgi:hypothetical protein
MKTNKSVLTLLAILTLVIGAQGEARDRVDRRQTRQAERVHEGKASGDITAGESARLRESKRVIRRNERRANADGTVTADESAKLEKMQDARSKQINRLKTNDKERPSTSGQ